MNSISAFPVAAPGLELSSLPADSNLDGLGVFRSILSGLSAGSRDNLPVSLPASLNAWLTPLPSDGNLLPSEANAKSESLPLPLQQLLGQLSAEDKAVLATWSAQDWQQWMMQQSTSAKPDAALIRPSAPDPQVVMSESIELQTDACQPSPPQAEQLMSEWPQSAAAHSGLEPQAQARAAVILDTATESGATNVPKIAIESQIADGGRTRAEPKRVMGSELRGDAKTVIQSDLESKRLIELAVTTESQAVITPEVMTEPKAQAAAVKQTKRATTVEMEVLSEPLALNAPLTPALPLVQSWVGQSAPSLDRQFKQPWQPSIDLSTSAPSESGLSQASPLPLPALNTPEVESSAHPLSVVSRLESWSLMPSSVVKADEKMLAAPIDPKAAVSDEQVPLLSRAAMEAELLPQASKQDAVSIETNPASAKLSAQAQQLLQTLDAKVLAQAARLPAQVWQPALAPEVTDRLKNQSRMDQISPVLPTQTAAAPMLSLMTQWLSQRSTQAADNQIQPGLPSLSVTPDVTEPIKFAASSPVESSAKFSVPSLTADSSEPVMEVTTSPLTETLMPPVVKPEPSSVVTKTEASQLSSLISTRDPEPMLDLRQPAWHEKLAGQMQSLKFMQLKEAEIRLDPPELGALKIQLSLQTDGGSQVSIQTAVPETRQLIEQSLPRLRELFQQQGLSLAQTNLSSGGQGQQPQQDSNPSAERHWSDATAVENPEETRPLSAAKPVRAGGVDHYA